MRKLLLLAVLAVSAGGCVNKMPLVSHAHMGHTLTTWHDTPAQEGLFVVAAKELDIAAREADLAWGALAQEAQAKEHVENVLHALNPDLASLGTGLGYGAIRALEGAIDHLEFAAASEDASDNMIDSVVRIAALGDAATQQLRDAQTTAQQLRTARGVDLQNYTQKLRRQLHEVRDDVQAAPPTPSLPRIDRELRAMLARETDPPYAPVPRRYVLGLVRLPSGLWGFRLPRRSHSGHAGYGGYGGYGGLSGY